jgi:hypothetical protein
MNAIKPPILGMGGLVNARMRYYLCKDSRLTGKPVGLFRLYILFLIPFFCDLGASSSNEPLADLP